MLTALTTIDLNDCDIQTALPAPRVARPVPLTSPAAIHFPVLSAEGLGWPREVNLIMSSLDAAQCRAGHERRERARRRYRVAVRVRLFGMPQDLPPQVLYSRDLHTRGMGFVTREMLPVGRGGAVEIPTADGAPLRASITVVRCRDIGLGWFEGSLHFVRDLFDLPR
ncbi:hypothetical protein [Humisphaera borealis]|uniref:PilZ domain-containing protein n=1 Tax=Humisphaera borealis TaxID=2807512 RepID=A0A7M2WYS8_9BACT|nr:hypothetical protein [Humisphaera borealis]QOV89630.1 hypothetical protein IPV69_26150 [Humisphaera borealis]